MKKPVQKYQMVSFQHRQPVRMVRIVGFLSIDIVPRLKSAVHEHLHTPAGQIVVMMMKNSVTMTGITKFIIVADIVTKM